MLQVLRNLFIILCERLGIACPTPYPHIKRTLLGTTYITSICIVMLFLAHVFFWTSQSLCFFGVQGFTLLEKTLLSFTIQSIDETAKPETIPPSIQKSIPKDAPFIHLYTLPNARSIQSRLNTDPPNPALVSALYAANERIDYALIQAFAKLSIAHETIFPFGVEHHQQGHLFQRLQIHTDQTIERIRTAMASSLALWANHARIYQSATHTLLVNVDDAITHVIYILPSKVPFIMPPPKGEPRLSIVMDDLGESLPIVKRLLRLNVPITFSIWPHSTHASKVATLAHTAGHEVFIHQPMEPLGYPRVKPGKDPILTNMDTKNIEQILQKSMDKVPFAIGLNNHMGSRFTTNKNSSAMLVDILSRKAYVVLDSLTHPRSVLAKEAYSKGVSTLERTLFLDDRKNTDSALQSLYRAERIAGNTGFALVIGHPRASTLKALETWLAKRDTKIHIVPLRYQKPFKP